MLRRHQSYPLHFPNAPFHNQVTPYENQEWPSSFLGSLDGVALDSVGLDILYSQTKNNEDEHGHKRIMIRENATIISASWRSQIILRQEHIMFRTESRWRAWVSLNTGTAMRRVSTRGINPQKRPRNRTGLSANEDLVSGTEITPQRSPPGLEKADG